VGCIASLEIDLPCLEEQVRIAEFLSELDKRIGLEKQLVEQPKGIVQELLSPE